jgi:hypothetical protein
MSSRIEQPASLKECSSESDCLTLTACELISEIDLTYKIDDGDGLIGRNQMRLQGPMTGPSQSAAPFGMDEQFNASLPFVHKIM